MAPGGEMYRLYEHFGENVLCHGSHEWLPYSKNAMRTKSPNTNLPINLNLQFVPEGLHNCQLSIVHCQLNQSLLSASMGLRLAAWVAGSRPKITPMRVENTTAITMAGKLMATGIFTR